MNEYPSHYFELTLHNLKLASFTPYALSDEIPCELSTNWNPATGRQPITCILTEADDVNKFVKVKIINLGFFNPGTYWIALDDIVIPAPVGLAKVDPFDISIVFMAPNEFRQENYFR